jgi:hypothetical protein
LRSTPAAAHGFFAAHGFLAAQGLALAAHGFRFAAQGFWASCMGVRSRDEDGLQGFATASGAANTSPEDTMDATAGRSLRFICQFSSRVGWAANADDSLYARDKTANTRKTLQPAPA